MKLEDRLQSVDSHGFRLFEAHGEREAKEILNELGIEWEEEYTEAFPWYNWMTGKTATQPGSHLYFLNEAGDNPAYYTSIMQTLAVFATPRGFTKQENEHG